MDNQILNGQFFTNGARIVKVTDWLDWAICAESKDEQWAIVLPMIQRGSVWKPHQVIDLWDTILRGMPFGGLMASLIPTVSNVHFFHPLDRAKAIRLTNGGLSLIDGQQRTLALLIAWPAVEAQMQRRIWVDFGEDDTYDHVLRLHFTTDSSPMGYQRGGPSGQIIARLSLAERRLANATYADRMESIRAEKSRDTVKLRYLHDKEIVPWHSTFALDLRLLIAKYREGKQLALYEYVVDEAKSSRVKLEARIKLIEGRQESFGDYDPALLKAIIGHLQQRANSIQKTSEESSGLERRVDILARGLKLMSEQYFPVIEVPERLMSAEEEDERKDPPLAVLFKRIGTGGTDLKTADYVFSVIKHLNPECHNLVETQLQKPPVAALYTPTNLVMSAVRLTAAKLEKEDQAKLDKAQFTRLLRGDKTVPTQDIKESIFYIEFNQQISQNGAFVTNLNRVLGVIAYLPGEELHSDTAALDIGLPLHALSLIQIPALEVILCWLQKSEIPLDTTDLKDNRDALIRFLLCWHLTVSDSIKATKECFKLIAKNKFSQFPEALLFKTLTEQGLALPICTPDALFQQQVLPTRIAGREEPAMLIHSSDAVNGLRGWRRFVAHTDAAADEAERIRQQQSVKLYGRWWNLRGGYSHALLLWLQRDYIYRRFNEVPAQPGVEDDTPYDFDHICAHSHWGDWTGKTDKTSRLIDFHAENIEGADEEGHWRLGHAIGNVRVWDSTDNRSDGDTAPSVKLKLADIPDMRRVLCDSVIAFEAKDGLSDETQAWEACGPGEGKSNKYWTINRARAFQRAIELRTFNLYQRFYTDLRFVELTNAISAISQSNTQ